ncbi:protein kinase [bacterium]|nr:protein kinase [candidate division CSSED10-310 bacterium]
MSSQPRRCPTCLNIMPLARRRCPHCFHEIPINEDTRSLEVLFLQEKLGGKFEVLSELHRHGNSTLFLAQDLLLDRKIALKSLKFHDDAPASLIERWHQNLKRCLRLDEPHLARIYTYGAIGMLYYIILEFIDCDTLENVIATQPSGLPIWKCLRIGRDIAQGLHAAHNMGITHHRLTPSNVSVSRDGFSRVLDLGAAQGTVDALAQRPWSAIMDSSLYFAPEQIESGISEPQSDQYRLAAVLYHALTGRPAFEDTGEEGAFARLQQDPRPITDINPLIPQELNAIILKAMSRHPDDRFSDCHEFALQLESLEPDYWLPNIETIYRAPTPEATVALLLADVLRNEKNRDYYRALVLCEQALALAPYNTEVTNTLVRIQKLHDKEQNLRSLVNKALVAFYSDSLNEALSILQTGRQMDKDNPEVMRLTHEVMQEQERKRLVNVLLDAAKIDLAKQAFSSAMSNIVRILDIDSRNETALKLKQRIEVGMEDRATIGSLLNRALSAYEGDNLDEADEILNKLLSIDQDNFSAKNLKTKISQQKKHHLLMSLWENLDREFRCGQYRKAIEILKQIADIEPTLKQDIRDRLVRIRQKIAEQNEVIDIGDTQPLKAVKSSDLSKSTSIGDQPEIVNEIQVSASTEDNKVSSLDKTPVIVPGMSISDTSSEVPRLDLDSELHRTIENQQHADEVAARPSIITQVDSDEIEKDDEPVGEVEESVCSEVIKTSRSRMLVRILGPWFLVIIVLFLLIARVVLRRSPGTIDESALVQSHLEYSDPQTSTEKPATSTISPTVERPINTIPPDTRQNSPIPTVTPFYKQPTAVRTDLVLSILASARNNERLGNYDTAATLYQAVLRRDPYSNEAKDGLERCQDRAKKRSVEHPHKPTPRPSATEVPVQPTFEPTKEPESLPVNNQQRLENVVCSPSIPVKGKSLSVLIQFRDVPGAKVSKLWLNYKKQADSLGYSQLIAQRKGEIFEVLIPGKEIRGTILLYYLNGFDENGVEFFIGSPNEPKILP